MNRAKPNPHKHHHPNSSPRLNENQNPEAPKSASKPKSKHQHRNQKRHQRIPSQPIQLSNNKHPKNKTTGHIPRREAHQISLAPSQNQVPKRCPVEAASIPPGKFRQPSTTSKTAFHPKFYSNQLN